MQTLGSKFLSQDYDLRMFRMSLAVAIGLSEAIVLNQIHYWLCLNQEKKTNFYDGRYWTYGSMAEWHKQFPFWSEIGLRKVFKRLEDIGILIVGNYNKISFDKTKWYSIDYEKLDEICLNADIDKDSDSIDNTNKPSNFPFDTKYQIDMTQSIRTIPYNNIKKNNNIIGYNIIGNFSNEKSDIADYDFEYSILIKQVNKCLKEIDVYEGYISDIRKTVLYYYNMYYRHFAENHKKLNNKTMKVALDTLQGFMQETSCGYDDLIKIIDRHFATDYEKGCDFSFRHFCSEAILYNRYNEVIE